MIAVPIPAEGAGWTCARVTPAEPERYNSAYLSPIGTVYMGRSPWYFLWRRLVPQRLAVQVTHHFIHIPKNGGQSMRAALARRGDVSLTTPLHSRYKDVVGELGPDLRYFCIVRNPWSRTASRYLFARQNCSSWALDDPRRVYMERATFADFVEDQKIFDIPEHPGRPWMGPMNSWFNQLDWITDDDDVVRADCLRLEHLDADIAAYFGEPLKIPRRNTTRERFDYRNMYTDTLAGNVARTFAKDIAYFGFSFDSSAKRNVFALSGSRRLTNRPE